VKPRTRTAGLYQAIRARDRAAARAAMDEHLRDAQASQTFEAAHGARRRPRVNEPFAATAPAR